MRIFGVVVKILRSVDERVGILIVALCFLFCWFSDVNWGIPSLPTREERRRTDTRSVGSYRLNVGVPIGSSSCRISSMGSTKSAEEFVSIG